MKYSKKMILTPFKAEDELMSQIKVDENPLNDLNNILRRSDLTIDEKMKLYLSNFSKLREKNDFNSISPTIKVLDTIQNILLDIQLMAKEKKKELNSEEISKEKMLDEDSILEPNKKLFDSPSDKNQYLEPLTLNDSNRDYYNINADYKIDNNDQSSWNNSIIESNPNYNSPSTELKLQVFEKIKKQVSRVKSNKSIAKLRNESEIEKEERHRLINTPVNPQEKNKRKPSKEAAVNLIQKQQRSTRNNNPKHDSPEQKGFKLQVKTFY